MTSEAVGTNQRFTEGFLKWLPAVNWFLTITIAVAVFFLSFRDSQTSQAAQIIELRTGQDQIKATIRENKDDRIKQIEDIRKDMVTRQLSEAQAKSIETQIQLLREDLKQLRDSLERNNYQQH